MAERPDFAAVLAEHLPGDYTHLFFDDPGAIDPPVGCRCGWRRERGVSQQDHLAAALNAAVDAWLADEETRERVAIAAVIEDCIARDAFPAPSHVPLRPDNGYLSVSTLRHRLAALTTDPTQGDPR